VTRTASGQAQDLADVALLRAGSLAGLATLGDDGTWRTPDGAVTDAIAVPRPEAAAVVNPAARTAAHRDQDTAWLEHALDAIARLARERRDLTVDECWAATAARPRDPRQMSALIVSAQNAGLIEKTAAHRPSTRPSNGGRSVHVWRSLTYQGKP
jgi:hypothetical protein